MNNSSVEQIIREIHDVETTLDDLRYFEIDTKDENALNAVEAPQKLLHFDITEIRKCSLAQILVHPKTEQLVRLFGKYLEKMRAPISGPLTVKDFRKFPRLHREFYEFVQRLPLQTSMATRIALSRLVLESLTDIQRVDGSRHFLQEWKQDVYDEAVRRFMNENIAVDDALETA